MRWLMGRREGACKAGIKGMDGKVLISLLPFPVVAKVPGAPCCWEQHHWPWGWNGGTVRTSILTMAVGGSSHCGIQCSGAWKSPLFALFPTGDWELLVGAGPG